MSSDLIKQEVKTEFEEVDEFDSVEEIDLVMGLFCSRRFFKENSVFCQICIGFGL